MASLAFLFTQEEFLPEEFLRVFHLGFHRYKGGFHGAEEVENMAYLLSSGVCDNFAYLYLAFCSEDQVATAA